ncbi:MAG: hypothetical protein ACRDG7_10070 [Candidatus Limnocylindria bacterium]
MDDLQRRYARLVAAFGAAGQRAIDADWLASDAEVLAAEADSSWLRVQARALAAASRAVGGSAADLESIVDCPAPPVSRTALRRLDELLAGPGTLGERLATHDAGMAISAGALQPAAEGLLQVFQRRAAEDLELSVDHELSMKIVDRPAETWRSKLDPGTLILNRSVAWTADRLVRVISNQAYPGRHLVQRMRQPAPVWSPSPETTVDRGLAAVGREILLADHELAYELERIGRRVAARWNGTRIVAVRRALDDLAPSYAAAALASPFRNVRREIIALGAEVARADALIDRWRDPMARAHSLARAAGPPLVRGWLVMAGQTVGLRRLLSERLVPTMLRADMVDGTV